MMMNPIATNYELLYDKLAEAEREHFYLAEAVAPLVEWKHDFEELQQLAESFSDDSWQQTLTIC